jgi:hypothetical protein
MLCVTSTFHSEVFPLWLIKVLQLYYGYCIYIYNVPVVLNLSTVCLFHLIISYLSCCGLLFTVRCVLLYCFVVCYVVYLYSSSL